jgi:serine/threonine-protein kinase
LQGNRHHQGDGLGIAHTDFGGSGEQRTRVGDAGHAPHVVGTDARRKLDGRSDLFSVGIVLARCWAGSGPSSRQRRFAGDEDVNEDPPR